ncbi:geranylgeranyl transferase type-2 subunit beta-like isoform X2 [Pollicipes pollicipes]|uniref:geranylgeranyl transferase type-2 subunit beta-like isoform X2 n=1 Tax=Pollicipes pollicipes TaxID=41117 RepID=UPI001885A2B0|nr:geranylgeranyl transferase type-2 subunit beta-like isoform X2 [Pollicipes pollicipes]
MHALAFRQNYIANPRMSQILGSQKQSGEEDAGKCLLYQLHIKYLASYLTNNKNEMENTMTEFLRTSGAYWTLTALHLLHAADRLERQPLLEFVRQCQAPSGGVAGHVGHDPHLLYTLSAVQICCIYDAPETLDVEKLVAYVAGLQRPDGSFQGDAWGEVDTRFSFCAVACLALLGRMDAIDAAAAGDYVLSCMNWDGGFGSRPRSESHAGQMYCCLGALSLLGRLASLDADRTGWWLCERQLPAGGLNGRPQKLADVCYSWWVLASLAMIGRLHWIDEESVKRFILRSQDPEEGGMADRPGDVCDPFHTLFGLAGLSLLGDRSLAAIDPVLCMPAGTLRRLGLRPQRLRS